MANLASKYDFSKPSGFREIAFFYDLKKKPRCKKNYSNFNFSTQSLGVVRVHSGVANLESIYDGSNSFGFRDMAFFMIFSCFFFQKNLDIKKIRYKKLT